MTISEWVTRLEKHAKYFCMEHLGCEFDGMIKINPVFLNLQKYGEYVPDTNSIHISKDLIMICEGLYQKHKGYLSVLEHELVHWFCIKNGLIPYDSARGFENILSKLGLITNHNMPGADLVYLAHGNIKSTHCSRCGQPMYDLLEINDYKLPNELYDLIRCDCGEPKLEVSNPKMMFYHTYEYLYHNSHDNLYQLTHKQEQPAYYKKRHNIK